MSALSFSVLGHCGHHYPWAVPFTSEYRVKSEGRGRTVDEWKLRVDGADNHWFDAIVGCAVAASMQGAALPGLHYIKPKRRVITYSQLVQEKRMKRQRMGVRSTF